MYLCVQSRVGNDPHIFNQPRPNQRQPIRLNIVSMRSIRLFFLDLSIPLLPPYAPPCHVIISDKSQYYSRSRASRWKDTCVAGINSYQCLFWVSQPENRFFRLDFIRWAASVSPHPFFISLNSKPFWPNRLDEEVTVSNAVKLRTSWILVSTLNRLYHLDQSTFPAFLAHLLSEWYSSFCTTLLHP